VVTGLRLGRWDVAIERFQQLRDELDERRDDPPYFAAHAFAAAGLIHQARGHSMEVDRIASILMPLATARDSARLSPWMAKLLVERGDLGSARDLLVHPPDRWRVHEGTTLEAWIDLVTAEEGWDEAPGLLDDARRHAAKAELVALPAFCDRLAGRAALAAGAASQAVSFLETTTTEFTRIGAAVERARTQGSLARALHEAGRTEDARAAAVSAMEVFEGLGSIGDVRRTQETLGRIGDTVTP
jgi:hypothetical protein